MYPCVYFSASLRFLSVTSLIGSPDVWKILLHIDPHVLRLQEQARTQHLANELFNETPSYPPSTENPFGTSELKGFFQEPREGTCASSRSSGNWRAQREGEVRVSVSETVPNAREARRSLRMSDTKAVADTSESETLSVRRQQALISEDKTRCRFSEVSRSRSVFTL